MKKLIALFSMLLFVGAVSVSVLALTDDDPKKQSTEASCSKAATAESGCAKQSDEAKVASSTPEASAGEEKKESCDKSAEAKSACCKKAATTASAE